MKSKLEGTRGSSSGRRRPPMRITPLRMEWMDPMSWRLPSGKALAEFALQSGFLAPLMLGGPRLRKIKAPTVAPGTAAVGVGEERVRPGDGVTLERVLEEPGHPGTFRPARSADSR